MPKTKYWSLPEGTDGIVVWNSTEKFYHSFVDATTLYYWYQRTPRRDYHEVIRRHVPRKFFLDLDDEPNIDRIVQCTESIFGPGSVLLFETSPQRYHIVVKGFHTTSPHTWRIVAQHIEHMTKTSSIDMASYAEVKSMRLEGSRKGIYTKRSLSGSSFLDGLITHIPDDSEEIPPIPPPERPSLPSTLPSTVDTLAFQTRNVSGNTVFLDRIRPSHCPQCQRTHYKENAAIINGRFVCWRYYNK